MLLSAFTPKIFTEKAPYSTSTKDCAIILEVLKNSAPGSIDALSIVILGTDVDPACHNALSSLRSIILQCWDFDPAKRPRSSRISEKIAIPSEMKAHSAAWEDQEGGTSSLRIRDDSRHGGSASQKDVPPCRAHPLCMVSHIYVHVHVRGHRSLPLTRPILLR